MLELAFSGYMFNKYRSKNKENLDNTDSTKPSNYKKSENLIYSIIGGVIEVIILIVSLVLFFKCRHLKNNFLEFLAALCYPILYIIYRILVPVNDENCKSDEKETE